MSFKHPPPLLHLNTRCGGQRVRSGQVSKIKDQRLKVGQFRARVKVFATYLPTYPHTWKTQYEHKIVTVDQYSVTVQATTNISSSHLQDKNLKNHDILYDHICNLCHISTFAMRLMVRPQCVSRVSSGSPGTLTDPTSSAGWPLSSPPKSSSGPRITFPSRASLNVTVCRARPWTCIWITASYFILSERERFWKKEGRQRQCNPIYIQWYLVGAN